MTHGYHLPLQSMAVMCLQCSGTVFQIETSHQEENTSTQALSTENLNYLSDFHLTKALALTTECPVPAVNK